MCDPKKIQNATLCTSKKSLYWSPPLFHDNFLHNITRCFPRPQCYDNIDQTNCSDISRVGLTCKINSYISTVSKYIVCLADDASRTYGTPLCDDGFDRLCVEVSHQCFVHKHQLCDGIPNCEGGIDERISICHSMTISPCIRRGGNGTVSRPIPLAWLTDGTDECIVHQWRR